MRNLTFGVLIIFVGLVAALPFRKSPSPDSSDHSLATGPSDSLVVTEEAVSFDPLLVSRNGLGMSDVNDWPQPQHSPTGIPGTLASQGRHPQAAARIPSNAQASPRRDLRLPLTYDDLAVPLVTPKYVNDRFGAVASEQPARPAADSNLPAFESMAVTNANRSVDRNADPTTAPFQKFDTRPPSILQRSIQNPNAASQPEPVVTAKVPVEGRLASDARPARDSQPAVQDDSRPRHWIRQPE